jgi:protoheme IX farnesyltransferase
MLKILKNYLLVAKPGIVFGNLISAAGGFLLASKGQLAGLALLWTLLGIALVVASGGVFNNCADRQRDRRMLRTRHRPLARGLIKLPSALAYATLLGLTGLALLGAAANLLAVVIVLAGLVIYVVVYSLYLKRRSVYSALIGSLAGAAPPLAGYCAVTGRFDLGALILLAIFSLWQMPHWYAIAVFRLDD